MKKGWTYKKLGEVCDVICGQSPDGKSYNNDGNGTPFYQGKKDFTFKYIGVPTMWTTTATKFAEKGDLLMSVRAPVGDVNFATQRVCIGRGLAAIRSKGILDKDYLFYFLLAKKSSIKGKEGVGFASINKGDIMDIDIEYPVQSKQVHIVSRLDSAFSHIDEMKANAEKLLSEARNLFQKSLDKAMEPKKGWKEMRLKESVILITDGDHQPPPKSNEGIPFITISDINKETRLIIFEDTFHVPQAYYENLKEDRKPRRGDVLYTVTGSFGIPVLIDFDKEFCFQRHIALIRPKQDELISKFLYYWILSSYAMSQAEDTATGAAQRTVSLSSLRNFNISIPPLSEQQRIVERLDALSAHVRELEENQKKIISQCDALKQALLRKVFE